VVVEQIFGIAGLGSYLVQAVLDLDLPVIQGSVVVFVLLYVGVNLVVDLAYRWLNPRLRVS